MAIVRVVVDIKGRKWPGDSFTAVAAASSRGGPIVHIAYMYTVGSLTRRGCRDECRNVPFEAVEDVVTYDGQRHGCRQNSCC